MDNELLMFYAGNFAYGQETMNYNDMSDKELLRALEEPDNPQNKAGEDDRHEIRQTLRERGFSEGVISRASVGDFGPPDPSNNLVNFNGIEVPDYLAEYMRRKRAL